jgi:hypothetical protein
LEGGLGHDTLRGDAGNDVLLGGAGNDVARGGSGNDWFDGGDGGDNLAGDAGADTLIGNGGNDALDGGSGNDWLDGRSGNDTLNGGAGRDTMIGGSGSDSLAADRGDENLSGGERVHIKVATDSPQTDSWSCGPNSASRLLRSYGINVSYETLRSAAQNSNIISEYGLGTPPPALEGIMDAHRSTSRQSGASFDKVLNLLSQGRPVIALVGWGSVTVPVPNPNPFLPVVLTTAPEKLHYVVLTGFDKGQQRVFYTDTDGQEKSYSFATFQARWNWPGDGVIYDGLKALGIKKNTILW